MNRRHLLKLVACAAGVPLIPGRLAAASGLLAFRRRRPSDASWPSKSAWSQLDRATGGNLIAVQSPLPNWHDLNNPYYIGDHPGVTQTLGWVDAWVSRPSVYAVAARSAANVAAAIDFARENDLRLVVRGGAHSYLGTSNAPDSLMIWTRHMNDVTMHDNFVPQGCAVTETEPAVTLGAGAMWVHAYDAVTTNAGRYVQCGGCTTVGVAGLIQSGGFGSFSKHYGSAASGLLEAEVVTADGKIRVANACTNPDLFWALKGGGGGTFGVVTKITLRVRELPEFFGGVNFTVKASSDAAFRQLIAQTVEFYAEHLFNDRWGEQIGLRRSNTLNVSMVSYGLETQAAKDVWQPFLAWIAQRPRDYALTTEPFILSGPARNWWNAEFLEKYVPSDVVLNDAAGARPGEFWWSGDADQVGQFLYRYESLWLPASLLESSQRSTLADALFATSRYWGFSLHFNKGLAGAPADAIAATRDTATNPAVCAAFALVISAAGQGPAYPGIRGHEPDVATGRVRARAIHDSMNQLRAIAPDGGSYVSESDFFDSQWQNSYWGANYARLAAVKQKYDADGLFVVHHGVGSEHWSADGFTRLS